MKVEFRKIKTNKLDSFVNLMHESIRLDFPHYSKKSKDYILAHDFSKESVSFNFEKNIYIYWGAFIDKKVAGYLVTLQPMGGVILLIWLGVKKENQHQGIGRGLLGEFSNWAKKAGVHTLQTFTVKEDLGFYKKIGFIRVGKIEKSYYGVTDYYLYKILQEPKEENFLK